MNLQDIQRKLKISYPEAKKFKEQCELLDLFNVRLRYLNIYECDCGWSGNISQLYYRVEHMGINAMLECPSCYTELIRLY